MKREDIEAQSDRDILVDLRVCMAVLEERTVDLPEIRQKVLTNERDILWVKRIGLGFISIVGMGIGIFKWVVGF